MTALTHDLSKALYEEEAGLIDAISYLIKQVNGIYMEAKVKDQLINLLNKLLDDTVKHSNLISKELTKLL